MNGTTSASKVVRRIDAHALRPFVAGRGAFLEYTVVGRYATRRPSLSTLSSTQVPLDPAAVRIGHLLLSVGTAAVLFASPLIGLHQMLKREKSRRQAGSDKRLAQVIGDLQRVVDNGDLQTIEVVNKTISSLVAEREVIRKSPTSAWSHGALAVLVSAVLLPIVVWLIQYVLEPVVRP